MLRSRNNFTPVRRLSWLCLICSFFTLMYDRGTVSIASAAIDFVSGWRHVGEDSSDSPRESHLSWGPLLAGVGCGVRKSTSFCGVHGNRCFSFGIARSPPFGFFAGIRSPHRSRHPERGRRKPPVALFDQRDTKAVPSARRTQESIPGSARPRPRSAALFGSGGGGERAPCSALRRRPPGGG